MIFDDINKFLSNIRNEISGIVTNFFSKDSNKISLNGKGSSILYDAQFGSFFFSKIGTNDPFTVKSSMKYGSKLTRTNDDRAVVVMRKGRATITLEAFKSGVHTMVLYIGKKRILSQNINPNGKSAYRIYGQAPIGKNTTTPKYLQFTSGAEMTDVSPEITTDFGGNYYVSIDDTTLTVNNASGIYTGTLTGDNEATFRAGPILNVTVSWDGDSESGIATVTVTRNKLNNVSEISSITNSISIPYNAPSSSDTSGDISYITQSSSDEPVTNLWIEDPQDGSDPATWSPTDSIGGNPDTWAPQPPPGSDPDTWAPQPIPPSDAPVNGRQQTAQTTPQPANPPVVSMPISKPVPIGKNDR